MSEPRCSFCRKYGEPTCLISGEGGIYICHECIALCNRLLAAHRSETKCQRCTGVMPGSPLTKRQAQLYAYLASFIATHAFAPSFDEIAEHFEFRSLATVAEHVGNLERKGWIRRRHNEARSIELVAAAPITSTETEQWQNA